jgi:hydroxyacylglutathione hydrolase
MPAEVHLFKCLKDNYGVLLHDPESGETAAIDAPEAAPVDAALRENKWRLTDILITHHHNDHTAGIEPLKKTYGCRVVAPRREAKRIPGVDITVKDGDVVSVGNTVGRVIETPGHTTGHVSYWFKAEKLVFVGDTLFSIGCGRLLEGNPQMMWESLLKLRNLPLDTQIYCGHEYTAANVHFALTLEPQNPALRNRAEEVLRLCDAHKPTIPTTIAAEKAANPFLRADVPSFAAAIGLPDAQPVEIFATVRARKDRF